MIRDLAPYPAYQDSGVPWLGDVPAHWDVRRLKQICRLAYGDSLPTEGRDDGPVPVYGSNGRVGFHSSSNAKGPCIVVGRKGSFGKVNFSNDAVFAIDTTFFVDERYTTNDLRWLFYLLVWLRLDTISKDSAVPGLDREDAYQRMALAPPLPEQTAIVRFLDHADRRIRRYIRAKQRLIALLNEQKQAIIHRAVTRGLDPTVPLKPSGVEWLGDVPAHWEVSRLKFATSHIVDCLHATPQYDGSGDYPAIRTADVEPGRVRLSTARRVNREQYERWTTRLTPESGDILYSREGERYGIAALVPDDTQLCISQRMMIFRVRPEYDSNYIMWQLNCRHVYAQASADIIGATSPHVNVETIKNYQIILPPLLEQQQIGARIAEETAEIDQSTELARREIALMREYRTRLIADVVTGELDVRAAAASLPDEVDEPVAFDDTEALAEDDAPLAANPDADTEEAEA